MKLHHYVRSKLPFNEPRIKALWESFYDRSLYEKIMIDHAKNAKDLSPKISRNFLCQWILARWESTKNFSLLRLEVMSFFVIHVPHWGVEIDRNVKLRHKVWKIPSMNVFHFLPSNNIPSFSNNSLKRIKQAFQKYKCN